jgi:hypothetical protein
MTDSGSGRRDDHDPEQPGSGGTGSDDDYTPSASWETSRGSSWESTTPYESPYAGPGSYGSASSYDQGSTGSTGSSAASGGSAADRPAHDGPWPSYPDQAQPDFGQPQGYAQAQGFEQQPQSYEQPQSFEQPQGYGQPTSYGSTNDPYAQTGYGQQPQYPQQPDYGQSSDQYGQQPGYDQYGQQQPAYGVNPYQSPAYGGYALPNHPQATTALILGIVGLAVCPFVGIAGFVMGGRVRREIDAAPGRWSGRGLATAGWVLGIISIVYAALLMVYLVVAVGFGIADS